MPSPAPRWFLRAAIVITAVVALLPLARLGAAWWEYARTLGIPLEETPPRGSVGVRWVDTDEGVVAAHVFASGPAFSAGVRDGDRLVELDYQPYFAAEDVEESIRRATGVVLAITVLRNGQSLTADVPVARDPTFLYPLSRPLWLATGWGFALVALVHALALLSVWPLARRARSARGAAALITAALVWVAGNLARHLWLTLFGAPSLAGPVAAGAFDALTLVALVGWIAFPVLLLRRALESDRFLTAASRGVRWALWVPPAVLAVGVATAAVMGHVGPLPPDAFVGPVLFYVCVYVATSTALSLWRGQAPEAGVPVWSRAGSAFVLALAAAGALYAYNALPAFARPALDDRVRAGWFIVALQLFSLLPVLLVSASTLRFGRFRTLLARSAATGAALSVVFVLVVVGALVTRALGLDVEGTGPMALGLWTVALLLLADWLAPPVRRLIARATASEAARGRQALDRLGERVRRLPDVGAMARETAEVVGPALGARSGVVFLRDPAGERWARAAYRPEPPHFSADELDRAWDRLGGTQGVWAQNEELAEVALPGPLAARLREIGVALAVPIVGTSGEAAGLIALGRKERRLDVYNLEEIDALKALGAQLAVASERLALVERERALERRTAEAELAALRAQINPHFLFNALNTIAALIAEKPDEAEATVETLAGLFRDVLTSSGKRFVPLAAEMRLVERYLAIEKARFGERLGVYVEVSPEAAETPVPAFAVQTLVENAVKHGIEGKRGGGAVRITALVVAPEASGDGAATGPETVVTVEDTGVGIPALFAVGASGDAGAPSPEAPPFHGVGLSNVADRLRQLYGTPDRLAIASSPAGTSASLRLPLFPSPL